MTDNQRKVNEWFGYQPSSNGFRPYPEHDGGHRGSFDSELDAEDDKPPGLK